MSAEDLNIANSINKPSCADLVDEDGDLNDGFELVDTINDPSWRHGLRVTDTFKRLSDSTYWSAHYRLSTDGETNELREGVAIITQVEPYIIEVTKYRKLVREADL